MRRIVYSFALFGGVVGLLQPENITNAGQPPSANSPNPQSQQDPKAKERLAEIEKAITAKEKELAALRNEADALRKQLSSNEQTFTIAINLFKDLPKESYPKPGKDGVLERAAADKWMNTNVVNKVVEWKATITNIEIEEPQNELFAVSVGFDSPLYVPTNWDSGLAIFGEPIVIGDQKCIVAMYVYGNYIERHSKYIFTYPSCTAEEAKHLRELKGKNVTFQSPVVGARFMDSGVGKQYASLNTKEPTDCKYDLACILTLGYPAIDGFKVTNKGKKRK